MAHIPPLAPGQSDGTVEPFDPMHYNPRLWEGLPSQTNRYDDTNAGPRKKRTIKPGVEHITSNEDQHADMRLLDLPGGWAEFHHPVEGRPYFYNSELRIVTEMYIRHVDILQRLMAWYEVFLVLRNHVLPGASTYDLFLDFSGGNTCRYYLVDHSNKTICWLRQRTTADLGISDVRSRLHLRALLNEEYWTHIEYMPKDENHLGGARAELQGALASAMLDHMTSEGSTSPFTKAECKAYLLSLDKAAESGHMLYLNWTIGRVMGLLVHSRNVNVYGQFGARLDRTATVEGRRHPPRGPGYLRKSMIFGGGPVIHLNRLENLWIDRIIYTHHWRALLKDLCEEWTAAAVAGGVMWISNIIFVGSDADLLSKILCGASSLLSGSSGVYALYMLREHRALGKYAAHAANYFQLFENPHTGLQELSLRYSAPWAGVMWSFGLTCLAIIFHLVTSVVTIFGSYSHILATAILVIGVYVHARGVDMTIADLKRLPFRLGIFHYTPSTPVARAVDRKQLQDQEIPIQFLDTDYDSEGERLPARSW